MRGCPATRAGGKAMGYEFDWSSIPGALPYLWEGMIITLKITAVAVSPVANT